MVMRPFKVLAFMALLILSACGAMSQRPAPVTTYGLLPGAGSAGVHTVSRGDTLFSISNRYKVDMPTIISVNRLRAPFRLAAGQRLTLPPPRQYRVRYGDTLYGVSRLFNVSQTSLARLNNLQRPYALTQGQVIKLPSETPALGEFRTAQGRKLAVQPPPPAQPTVPVIAEPLDMPVLQAPVMDAPVPAHVEPAVMQTPPRAPMALGKAPGKFLQPVAGRVISGYGPKQDGLHNDGINIAAARHTPVKSAADGEVVYAGNALKGYGNLVLVKHGGGFLTAYAHLGRITVEKGQFLRQGDQIGLVGSSGQVVDPQLHFEIRKGTEALNPAGYI